MIITIKSQFVSQYQILRKEDQTAFWAYLARQAKTLDQGMRKAFRKWSRWFREAMKAGINNLPASVPDIREVHEWAQVVWANWSARVTSGRTLLRLGLI